MRANQYLCFNNGRVYIGPEKYIQAPTPVALVAVCSEVVILLLVILCLLLLPLYWIPVLLFTSYCPF